MARPRQRRKTRNPSSKVSRKQKNRNNVSFAGCGHRLIAENWDKTKTLKQNYERLGLLTQLNGRAGGDGDAMSKDVYKRDADDDDDGIDYEQLAKVAIERGAIGLRRCTEDAVEEVPLAMDQEEDDSDVDLIDGNKDLDPRAIGIGKRIGRTHELDIVVGHKVISTKSKSSQPSDFPILEQMIQDSKNVLPSFRHTSEQEARFLMDMARKHGKDYEKMSRDKKLNPMLLTVSQLKKKFERFERDIALLQTIEE